MRRVCHPARLSLCLLVSPPMNYRSDTQSSTRSTSLRSNITVGYACFSLGAQGQLEMDGCRCNAIAQCSRAVCVLTSSACTE